MSERKGTVLRWHNKDEVIPMRRGMKGRMSLAPVRINEYFFMMVESVQIMDMCSVYRFSFVVHFSTNYELIAFIKGTVST